MKTAGGNAGRFLFCAKKLGHGGRTVPRWSSDPGALSPGSPTTRRRGASFPSGQAHRSAGVPPAVAGRLGRRLNPATSEPLLHLVAQVANHGRDVEVRAEITVRHRTEPSAAIRPRKSLPEKRRFLTLPLGAYLWRRGRLFMLRGYLHSGGRGGTHRHARARRRRRRQLLAARVEKALRRGVETGGDDRHLHFVAHPRIDDRAEDDVRLFVRRFLN